MVDVQGLCELLEAGCFGSSFLHGKPWRWGAEFLEGANGGCCSPAISDKSRDLSRVAVFVEESVGVFTVDAVEEMDGEASFEVDAAEVGVELVRRYVDL